MIYLFGKIVELRVLKCSEIYSQIGRKSYGIRKLNDIDRVACGDFEIDVLFGAENVFVIFIEMDETTKVEADIAIALKSTRSNVAIVRNMDELLIFCQRYIKKIFKDFVVGVLNLI